MERSDNTRTAEKNITLRVISQNVYTFMYLWGASAVYYLTTKGHRICTGLWLFAVLLDAVCTRAAQAVFPVCRDAVL